MSTESDDGGMNEDLTKQWWRTYAYYAWLVLGLGPEPGMEPPVRSKDVPKKAVKCDMCKDVRGGAACVRACPTGAAVRVSPEQFLDFAGPG